jgi:hypothetical protein
VRPVLIHERTILVAQAESSLKERSEIPVQPYWPPKRLFFDETIV